MLPLHSQILVEAVSIGFTSVQQRQPFSLASLLQWLHFRSSCPALFCKKVFLKISQSSQLFPLVQVFPVNFAKF